MKKLTQIIGIVVLCLFLFACQEVDSDTNVEKEIENSLTQDGQGKAVFTITDAAADMGAVSKIEVSVASVQVHSTTQGWVEVAQDVGTFDLLALKAENAHALLADVSLAADTYDELRLDISKVMVTDNEGEHEAKLPSGTLKMKGELLVEEGTTAVASFDIIADESLHMTGNGKYILAPVVQLETKSNVQVDVSSKANVKVAGGEVKTSAKVGMDEKGNVDVGLKIPADVEVMLDEKGISLGKKVGLDISAEKSGNKESKGLDVAVDTDAAAEVLS